jgi:hypothetical protein
VTTFTFSVNNRPATGAIAMDDVLNGFVAAGWAVKASGDGIAAYSSSGSVFSNGGATGANGMANSYAWFRLQDPGGGREFCVERGTTNYNWAIAYSVAAHFTTGGSATAAPTASDAVAILGNITSSTGSGGTYAQLFATSDNTYSLHMGMADSSIDYAFWIYTIANATTTGSACWIMDFVQGADAGDTDPTVHLATLSASAIGGALTAAGPKCFFTSNASTNFAGVILSAMGAATAIGANAWNGLEDIIPTVWMSTTKGWKGYSSLFSYLCTICHQPGDVLAIGSPPTFGAKNHLCAGTVAVPWPAGTDSIV